VIPAPRRAARIRSLPERTRRVMPLSLARAEPIAAEPIEAAVATDESPEIGLASDCPRCGAAPAGDPQTVQYPSAIVPGQPGWLQRPEATTGAGPWDMTVGAVEDADGAAGAVWAGPPGMPHTMQ